MSGCALTSPVDAVPELKRLLVEVVRHADRTTARSQQKALGPSQVGDECMRRIAYNLANVAPVNTLGDPWFAIVGSAVHDWLAHAIDKYDAAQGRIKESDRRFLSEYRVTASVDGLNITGTCDLFDTETGTVIDHKVVGPTALKSYRANGPSVRYETQVQVYGLGHEQAGRQVNTVALAFFPRNGYLDDMYVWQKPYSRPLAEAALRRIRSIGAMIEPLGDHWPQLIPAHAGSECVYCPFYAPSTNLPDTNGCPGR